MLVSAAGRDQGHGAGFVRHDRVDDEINGVAGVQFEGGLGQRGAVHAGLAVDVGAVSMVRTSGRAQPAANGTPVMPAMRPHGQSVAGDLLQRLVAHHGGHGEQFDVRVAVGQEQRDGVVVPRIAVQDDLAGHGRNLLRRQRRSPEPVRGGCRSSEGRRRVEAMTSTTSHRGPLQGVRVLDFGTVYAAPITAMLLGDYGADVVKVEHPRGDPARTHGVGKDGHGLWWKVIARNKRTILDVRHAGGTGAPRGARPRCRRPHRELPPRRHGEVGHRARRRCTRSTRAW